MMIWAIVGASKAGSHLPVQHYCGDYTVDGLPWASNFKAGQWIELRFEPGRSLLLVAADILLGVGK